MTTQVNPDLAAAEQIFYNLVWKPAIIFGEAALEGAVPALALPLIKQLDETTINALSDWLFGQFCLMIDCTAITLLNSTHQLAYDDASLRLKVVETEKGIDSPEYKKAIADEADSFKKFITFIGS